MRVRDLQAMQKQLQQEKDELEAKLATQVEATQRISAEQSQAQAQAQATSSAAEAAMAFSVQTLETQLQRLTSEHTVTMAELEQTRAQLQRAQDDSKEVELQAELAELRTQMQKLQEVEAAVNLRNLTLERNAATREEEIDRLQRQLADTACSCCSTVLVRSALAATSRRVTCSSSARVLAITLCCDAATWLIS